MGGFWWDIATAVGLGVLLGNLSTLGVLITLNFLWDGFVGSLGRKKRG